MGLSWHPIKALIAAYKTGTNFEQTATIGRQNLYISPSELKALLALDERLPARFDEYFQPYPVYGEPLFQMLGANEIVSIDASNYENATVVHDMNLPISSDLKARFDFVLDGGSLEHVFNFPQAVKNCMEMVKVGGTLMMESPANNNLGHGFYQFSPDLLFRVLSPENGYRVERMIAYEFFDFSQWYEVADPTVVRSRVELLNCLRRVQLLVRARRTHLAEIFAKSPQQSDYIIEWGDKTSASAASPFVHEPSSYRIRLKRTLERWTPRLIRSVRSFKNYRANKGLTFGRQREFFRPVDE